MAQTVHLPFPVLRLRLINGEEIVFPLSDTNALHLQYSGSKLARHYATLFQKKLLDKGNFLSILDELHATDFSEKKLTVNFPAAKDEISFPEFQLEFDYFFHTGKNKIWGMIPALGVEAMAEEEALLEEGLREAVKFEFTSKRRMQSVHHIIASHWYSSAEITYESISLRFHTPAELAALQKEKKQSLLPKVAQKLNIRKPVAYGREEELGTMERILKSVFSRNILIVGASGSGKTALVWELARRRKELELDVEIWETIASVLIKELTQETGWQDNLSHLVKELTLGKHILYVRNLSELFEVGRYEGNSISIAEYLQSYLSRGEITMIAECTPEERARIDVHSPNYLSFFQVLQLEEPKTGVEEIISKKISDIAGQSRVRLDPEGVHEIVRLQRRFSPYSGMPGKPIRFLESILLGKMQAKEGIEPVINRSAVLRHFSEASGMPQFMIDPELPMDTEVIRQEFNSVVYGQEHAINNVVDMLAAVKTALTRTGKPIASFLFVGPTGVGKTEMAKVLAEQMFGSRERLLRFDMSEFSRPWLVSRLTGENFFTEGLLTSAVRREPFCVLLFDEIEKADPSFFELLLQMLSEGRLSDSQGRLVNFCSAIIIMTSNIGAAKMQRRSIGWSKEENADDTMQRYTKAVEDYFRPELFNRIDSLVAFRPLSRLTMRQVVQREISLFKSREGIRFRHLDLNISEPVLDFLAEAGYHPRYGARYLQRTIRERLLVPLARRLNQFPFDDRLMATIGLTNQEIYFHIESDPLGFDLLMEQWDKLTLAEQTSFHRRKISLISEGPLFMRFQSELDLLEQDKKLLGQKFWDNIPRSELYSNMLSLHEQYQKLVEAIQDMEVEIAFASMNQGPFMANYDERLEQWEKDFFDLRVVLHSQLLPKRDTCYFYMFGPELKAPLRFYLTLFRKKEFLINNLSTIWLKENLTDQTRPLPPDAETAERPESDPPQTSHYLLQDEPMDRLSNLKFSTPKNGSRMFGILLKVEAPCIWLYLKDEKGLQQWEREIKNEFTTVSIHPQLQEKKIPEGIHRSAFYQKNKPRRIVRNFHISDTGLDVSREILHEELVDFFIRKLDEGFQRKMEEIFFSAEPND